ncbi:MAG: hypothetical protein ABSG41_25900, partial [Bryobacteraceae bacterium]
WWSACAISGIRTCLSTRLSRYERIWMRCFSEFDPRGTSARDVSKDGRFLIHVPQDQAATNVPLTVVVNWQSALKK